MIKLERPPKPDELAENEEKLLHRYLKNKNNVVWREDYIVTELFSMTHEKCAYCEKKDYPLEVEHYYCKHKHPKRVVDWENLLPVCHRCNTQKSDHDCDAEPIINPAVDYPKDHVKYKNGRFFVRNGSRKGNCTITYLKLDNTNTTGIPRDTIFNDVDSRIEECIYRLDHLVDDPPVEFEITCNCVKKLFELTQKENGFSAIYATEILEHPRYKELKVKMKDKGIWKKSAIHKLEAYAKSISLA